MTCSGFFDDQGMQLANNSYRHPFDSNSKEGMDARDDRHGMNLHSAPSTLCPIPLHDLRGRFRDNEGILPRYKEEEEEEEESIMPGGRDIETVPVAAGLQRETGSGAHRMESTDSGWTWSEFTTADCRGLKNVCGSSTNPERRR